MANARKTINITTYDLFEPVFSAIKSLGGSATNDEIVNEIIKMLNLSPKIVDEPHTGDRGQTELEYQINWAKTYLKYYGAIENSGRRVWSITSAFAGVEKVTNDEVKKFISGSRTRNPANKKTSGSRIDPDDTEIDETEEVIEDGWKEQLSSILHTMNPYGFERLTVRILRESGFNDVRVTTKSGDGGIDGFGKFKINGMLSFNVAFQCKRYKGSVSSDQIRDFRGSLSTDIEKGIFITTGTFTKAAKEEASQPGKKQIELMDGDALMDKLAELNLGLEDVKTYKIDVSFFNQFNTDEAPKK